MLRKSFMLAAGAAALISGAAHAAAFTNGSFEATTAGFAPGLSAYTTFNTGSTDIAGWTVTSGNVDLVGTNYFAPDFVASNGNFSVDLNGNAPGTIAQTFDTVAGKKYLVTFDLNANVYDGDPNAIKTLDVSAGNDSGSFSYNDALHPQGQGGPWQKNSFTFTATGTSSTLSFASTSTTNNCCWGPELDNVTVTAVPEPASWALMITGLAMTGGALRRRRRAVPVV